MTELNPNTRPVLSAEVLFRRLAPTAAAEVSQQLHRAGLVNANDLIFALTTGLRSFARNQGLCLATEFPLAWPQALEVLRGCRSEAEWETFLMQTSTAPQVKGYKMAKGASQMIRILETLQQTADMSPRIATAFGTWVITAVVIAHSGPLDADVSLEELSDCL
ncbi:hypothetical protein [Sulfitobacter sp. M22]|uniref:hypothetical protein n=1 Tax=Sulfitobacter sp. M22 TaxID=2675332 RepID=UPI001F359328|nr:hypothetical protein [Sulfitobacter sp. M22]MCF7728016.1 hypothetical protein [Sulfitobacter sp. M22]